MKPLSKEQLEFLKKELDDQGISFEPLKSDLLDHMTCDIESLMADGMDFSSAMQTVKGNIPENHFKQLEIETMKILNSKINLTLSMGYLSLFLLVAGSFFKIMHLPGAGMLMVAFLIVGSVTLISGSIKSIRIYRESKGQGIIVLWATIILIFVASITFRILHLPGATELMFISTIAFCLLLPALSIYFYLSKQKLKDHLLIRLLQENQHILEKTALVLIGFGLIFNYSSLLLEGNTFAGTMYFIFSIILTGMYIYSLTWKYYVEKSRSDRSPSLFLLILSTFAFIMFMLPVIGGIFPTIIQQIMPVIPLVIFISIVLYYYAKISTYRYKNILATVSAVLLFYPILKLGIKLNWLGEAIGGLLTNQVFILGFLLVLIGLLIGFWKQHLFKLLIILMIAAHMIPNL